MGIFDKVVASEERVERVPSDPVEEARIADEKLSREGHESQELALVGANDVRRQRLSGNSPLPPGVEPGGVLTPRGVELLRQARRAPEFDEDKQAIFLEFLAETPQIELAAWRTGVMVSQVNRLRESDPAFEDAVNMARKLAVGEVEHRAFELAKNGAPKGVYYQGILAHTERQYLPDLMTKLMAANDERYTPKRKLEGEVGINHNWADMIKAMKEAKEE